MSDFNIAAIDPNMAIETKIPDADLRFHDVRAEDAFALYGLWKAKTEPVFKRLPDEIAKATNPGVASLYLQTAGGRLRFSSDSAYVALKVFIPALHHMDHMPLTGSSGFDLYIDTPVGSRFYRTFRPGTGAKTSYEAVIRFPSREMRHFTVNFPTYNAVDRLYIGLQADARLEGGLPYRPLAPMVIYGSSITQGACPSRPGLAYSNILSRRLNIDHINLGFSGNGKAEKVIVDYMKSLPMSVFISDYDHNAPDAAYLEKTHYAMYRAIRDANPHLPYIMLSLPDFDNNLASASARRRIVQETYRRARAEGDKHVYYIDGEGIFRGPDRDSCTVDGSHPNDIGMMKMADAIECMVKRALREKM